MENICWMRGIYTGWFSFYFLFCVVLKAGIFSEAKNGEAEFYRVSGIKISAG